MILVDTSVWIDFLRGEDSIERRMLHQFVQDAEELAITGIVLTEILQGIQTEKLFHTTREYLLEFPVFEPRGTTTYSEAARIYRIGRKNGKTIRSTVDCIIAAICLENGMAVFHKDRDYDLIQEYTDLKVLKVHN